ncbi:MAG TPA: hypothetical protein VI702_07210, partial [Nitrospiria bacterium]
TRQYFPDMDDAWVILGIVGTQEGFSVEARLSLAPLPNQATGGWLESLLGQPMVYAPLPPFP